MPIGAMTMILTNVGLQIFNNWRSSRQNKQLQQKREEYESAARVHNTQRMWQLMREGQELTRQLEEERHQQRLEELKNDVDNLLHKLAYSATINNWPLSVLPIVMKNQALGNLLANQEEKIALHCILTPSNYQEFNRIVFPRIEEKLDVYCSQNWSVLTDHPILFYSGAWRTGLAPTEIQIDSMHLALGNLPTLLITPYFRPTDGKLVFQLRTWGLNVLNNDFIEFEPSEFQRSYTSEDDYTAADGLLDEIIEDIVPYLQCLVGYMTDTYFWSSNGNSPKLPQLLTNGSINTDGMKYLIDDCREYYSNLFNNSLTEVSVINDFYLVNMSRCLNVLLDDKSSKDRLKKILLEHCKKVSCNTFLSIEEAIDLTPWSLTDLQFLNNFLDLAMSSNETKTYKKLETIKFELEKINYNFDILKSNKLSAIEDEARCGNPVALYRLGELYEYSMGVDEDLNKAMSYYNQSANLGFLLATIKVGVEKYNQQPQRIKLILHAMGVVQADLMYVEYLLKEEKLNKEKCMAIYKEITTPLIPTGRLHSHTGLITELAILMLNSGCDKKIPCAMLEIASKKGYKKAIALLLQIK
ncbi:SEL1-like repeat protein [uncultured Bacteroides sp.]|uniref:SEL1-like repeat protein n=1 Tax=uncultured Bacteroides sp. TaxID=162156 RepID=UPI0027D9C047|nr:SEL1-like repeat protein [uncultured Bacteroides sp.]